MNMKFCDHHNNDAHQLLSLKQIAGWQDIVDCDSNITARIPSLQRGAVWEPQQIEMLWDSIMRGFPIGSIVISKKIETQKDKKQITLSSNLAPQKETSHHILDGQQRCNAIAWGFADPWRIDISDDIVLWLDIKPNFIKSTTRKYLFRVTTKAHPWGFKADDQATNLSTTQIRDFKSRLEILHASQELPDEFRKLMDKNQVDQNLNLKRVTPRITLPQDAKFPVPMFLMQKYFNDFKADGVGTVNWDTLAQDAWVKVIELWSDTKISDLSANERTTIEAGLAMAAKTRMIALQVPDNTTSIDDIEQIFQRLNRQGTPLDNEELSYSMIKAYWPDVETVIDNLPSGSRHTTEARLVGMGIRVALTGSQSKKFTPELSLERIRMIFRADENKDAKDRLAFDVIKQYFENGEFAKTLEWIDSYFLFDKVERSYGVPAYLRSSIAWSSRDVFGWIMLLAKRFNYQQISDDKICRKIIGLALAVHWFGKDKSKAVDILSDPETDLLTFKITDLRDKETNSLFVLVPLDFKMLEQALQLNEQSSEKQLIAWKSFWEGTVHRNDAGDKFEETIAQSRADAHGRFIEKVKDTREMLLYHQRDYINAAFQGFDPSNKLMWKGHNRPWDYDHILPSNDLDGRRLRNDKTKYLYICQSWQQSIGNLIAVDLSFNRSAQDSLTASDKYPNDKAITTAFDFKIEDTDNIHSTRSFVLAAKNRFLEIYTDWHTNLLVS